MSVQFGRWNLDGKPVDMDYLEKVKPVIAPYGPDDSGSYAKTSISILYRAFHTTNESRHEMQPHVTDSGAVITWDGRLDNRAELIHQLRDVLAFSSTDVSIVAAAYEEWGTDCFAKLIGDWALSIWDANSRLLILAKDPIGARHLYYSFDDRQVTWSTVLDPLVLFAGKTFMLCEEYIAGCFSSFPAAHLTPYVGIHSVPPSSSVLLRPGVHTVYKYWDFDPGKTIRYRTDAEYEEHFRDVFAEAVRRRLRSDSPILAELSGGMDSSSIVCMADSLIARGMAETSRLDTVSYYDDSEPNWNERPYFTKVEQKRGRTGCHIEVGSQGSFKFDLDSDRFAATPSAGSRTSEAGKQFLDCMASLGNRVVLSGIGGDEIMGGVPTPIPELDDLLARARLGKLTQQLKVWALNKKKPWFRLFFAAARRFFPPGITGARQVKQRVPWLNSNFLRRNITALRGYECRIKLLGPLPSFQENLGTLDTLRRQLSCSSLPEPPYEKRYPYLDRGLLEFAFAIPREQLLRPYQRRSLMRRAVAGIVPEEVLDRKRKAFVARAPVAAILAECTSLAKMTQDRVWVSFGITDVEALSESLQNVQKGGKVPLVPLLRTFTIAAWLINLSHWGLLDQPKQEARQAEQGFEQREAPLDLQ
jgi:asparagine synthase (glutamine-hydrolysing)